MVNIEKLIQTGKSVFTVGDLKKILNTNNKGTIRNFLSKSGKKNSLIKLYYGIWGFKKYDIFEFSCKLNKNSYISFETVLKNSGVIFQYYGDIIFSASNKSIEKQAIGFTFKTYKIKNEILINPIGIENKGNYSIATIERAICDRLYISSGYHFDNLENIDFEKLREISLIYNKRVILEINNLIKNYVK